MRMKLIRAAAKAAEENLTGAAIVKGKKPPKVRRQPVGGTSCRTGKPSKLLKSASA